MASAACKKKEDAGMGTASATGTGSAAQVVDAAAAAPAGCDLVGDYRLRFRTNGAEGWFLRFAVTADGKGSFTESQTMLGVDPAPLAAVVLDAPACKLNVRGRGLAAGDLGLALEVDPKTGAVKGMMTRTKAVSDDDLAVPVVGWRTVGPPAMPDACFVPGIYKLQVDPRATWRNADPEDDRSCKGQQPTDVFVRIEAWGDDLSIDQVDTDPPHDQTWGSETVTRSGCEVAFGLQSESIDLNAKLTFVGGQVTGLVTNAKIQVVEETEESEDLWSCTTENARITLVKL